MAYLVGFSYAFFWVGVTGLTITVGAVATLFVLMQATGRVDWAEAFAKSAPAKPTPPASPASPPKIKKLARNNDDPDHPTSVTTAPL